MKHKKTIIKIIPIILTLWLFLYANATDIKDVAIKEVLKEWDNTLKVTLNKEMPDSWLSWEIKVFNDISITSIKDANLVNTINITAEKEIKVWNTYNIFSLYWFEWVEWSADFIVEENLNAKIISPTTEAQWITKITIKDKKNIVLEFRNPLAWNDFEFKLLEDLWVSEISSASWSIVLKTTSTIENNSDYILIWISLVDSSNNNYILDNSIYDFSIWDKEVVAPDTPAKTEWEVDVILNSAWDNPLNVTIWTWSNNTSVEVNQSWSLDINLWNVVNWSWALWNIETVAVKARTTPDTGPETIILMLLTLIINSIYFLTRKISA